MKASFSIVLISASLAMTSCNGCGGGGGGLWLVGSNGLMANLHADGTMGPGYDLGGTDDLRGIACRGADVAFVVGEGGTFLRTADAGVTWTAVDPGTDAALTDVAVSWENVYVSADDALRVSTDDGDSWSAFGADRAWRAISTTDTGELALAVAADGSVWRWDGTALTDTRAPFAANAAVLSHDGGRAAAVGDGGALAISDDGGQTWSVLAAGTPADLLAVWAGGDGAVLAAGASGAIVRVDHGAVTATRGADATLRAVRVDGDDDAFAAGDDGTVIESQDGGATWKSLDLHLTGTVYDLDDIE